MTRQTRITCLTITAILATLAAPQASAVSGATFLVDGVIRAAYVTPEWRR